MCLEDVDPQCEGRRRTRLAHHLSQGTGGANIALRQHVLVSLTFLPKPWEIPLNRMVHPQKKWRMWNICKDYGPVVNYLNIWKLNTWSYELETPGSYSTHQLHVEYVEVDMMRTHDPSSWLKVGQNDSECPTNSAGPLIPWPFHRRFTGAQRQFLLRSWFEPVHQRGSVPAQSKGPNKHGDMSDM